MFSYFRNSRTQWPYKLLVSFISYSFLASLILPPVTASAADPQKGILGLPMPGSMVLKSDGYTPASLKGVKIDPQNPLKFDFIIDSGKDELTGQALEEEANKLIKYFLATLTIPEDDLWVNLSPYESDRIIPEGFGLTEMGRDLLAQDYMLKQLVASLIYPEEDLGQEFWQRVYDRAAKEYGTTNIPINTFNKVWIVPEDALVVEHNGSAFVVDSHLKVMLEEDYLALEQNLENQKLGTTKITQDYVKTLSKVSSDVVREILLPEIEKEVNEGKNFAKLRQIYNSMILATWYKQNLRASLLGQVYVNKAKIKGVDVDDREIKQKIYDQYLEAFRKGVYNYIREDYDMTTKKVIPRKYFSGGFDASQVSSAIRTVDLQNIPPASPLRTRIDQGLNTSSPVVQVSAILAENPSQELSARGVVTAQEVVGSAGVASPVTVSPEVLKLYQDDIAGLERAAVNYGDRSFIADQNRAVAKSELARERKILGLLLLASRNALPADIAGKAESQLIALVDVANQVVTEGYSERLSQALSESETTLLQTLNEAELQALDLAALSSPVQEGLVQYQDLSPFGQQYVDLRIKHYIGYVLGSQGRAVSNEQAVGMLSRLNQDIARMVRQGRTLKDVAEQSFAELSDETRAFIEYSRQEYELNKKSNARIMADILIASLSAEETQRYDEATLTSPPLTFQWRWPPLDVYGSLEQIVRARGQVTTVASPISTQFLELSTDESVGELARNYGRSYDTMMSLLPFLAESTGVSEEKIAQELNSDTYSVFAEQLDQIAQMVKTREIFPEQVSLRVSVDEAEQAPVRLEGERTVPNVLFWALKGDPWQSGHLWMILEAVIKNKIDKVVIGVDNSDPTRKPDLSSLTIREAITQVIFDKYLKPFVQYTTIPKEMPDLFSADGETMVFYLAELNANQPMTLFYGAGSDHANLYALKKVGITDADFMSTIAEIENPVERQQVEQMFTDQGYIDALGKPVKNVFQVSLIDRLKERGYLDDKGKPVSGKFSAYEVEGKPEELLLSDLEGTGLANETARKVVYQALFAPDVPRKIFNKMTAGEAGLRGFQTRKDIQKMSIIFSQRKGEEVDENLLKAYEGKLAAALEARGLPELGLSTITQPMDTSSTDVRKRGQFWKVPWVTLQLAHAFKMWGYDTEELRDAQENQAKGLVGTVADILAGDLNEAARSEALTQIRNGLGALNGLGLNAFDKYVMGEIIKTKNELAQKAGQPEAEQLGVVDAWLGQVRELIFAQARSLAEKAIENPLPIRDRDQGMMAQLLTNGRMALPGYVREYYQTRRQRGLDVQPDSVAAELGIAPELVRATQLASSPITAKFAELSTDESVGELARNYGRSYDTMMSLLPFLAESTGVSEEKIAQELNSDTYSVFAEQLDQIAQMVKAREIFPEQVSLRVSVDEAEQAPVRLEGERTVPNVLFWALKGDPWQSGHLWMILEAVIKNKIDKVVIGVDNSDPTRKPDLSSLTIREAITQVIFDKYLKPFVQYTTIPKEMPDLFSADGETMVFYLAELNANQPMTLFYGAGSDHANLYALKKVGITDADFMSTIAEIENPVERQQVEQMFTDQGYIDALGKPVKNVFQVSLIDRLKERGYLDDKGKPVSGKFSAYEVEGKPEELLLSDLEGTGLANETARKVVYQALFAPDVPRKIFNKMTAGEAGLRGFQTRKDIQKMSIIFSQRKGEEVDENLLKAYEGKLAAALEARGLPELGLSTITQPMDTSSTDVRKRGQFWKVPWVTLQLAHAFKMWGYDTEELRDAQENQAKGLVGTVADILAGDLNEAARSEALTQIRNGLGALNGLGLNAFDKYVMGEIIKTKNELAQKAGQPEAEQLGVVDAWLGQVRELIFAQARSLAEKAIENPLPIRDRDQGMMAQLLTNGRMALPGYVREYYQTRRQRGLDVQPDSVAAELGIAPELVRATIVSTPIKKILIVDDTDEVRDLNRDIFDTIFAGAEIITAVNGEEGLKTFQSNPDIDMVVTDLDMPRMNGEQMARAIRAERDVPVVLISGNNNEVERLSQVDEATGLKSGIFAQVIQKPYQLSAIIALKEQLASSPILESITLPAEVMAVIGNVFGIDREVYGVQDAWVYAAIRVLLANQLAYPESIPPLRQAATIVSIKWQDGAYPVEDAMFRLLPATLAVGYNLTDANAYRILREAIEMEKAGQFDQAESKLTEINGIDNAKADQMLKKAAAVFNESPALSEEANRDLQLVMLQAGRPDRMPLVDLVALTASSPITAGPSLPLNIDLGDQQIPVSFTAQRLTAENLSSTTAIRSLLTQVDAQLRFSGVDVFSTLLEEYEGELDTKFMGWVLEAHPESEAARVVTQILEFVGGVYAEFAALLKAGQLRSQDGRELRPIEEEWQGINVIEIGGAVSNNPYIRRILEQKISTVLGAGVTLLPVLSSENQLVAEEAGVLGAALLVDKEQRRNKVVIGIDVGGTSAKLQGAQFDENGDFVGFVGGIQRFTLQKDIAEVQPAEYYSALIPLINTMRSELQNQQYDVSDVLGMGHPGKKEADGTIAQESWPNRPQFFGVNPASTLQQLSGGDYGVVWMNDAFAGATALYELSGERVANARILYIGPGTGLGAALLKTDAQGVARMEEGRDLHAQHDPYIGAALLASSPLQITADQKEQLAGLLSTAEQLITQVEIESEEDRVVIEQIRNQVAEVLRKAGEIIPAGALAAELGRATPAQEALRLQAIIDAMVQFELRIQSLSEDTVLAESVASPIEVVEKTMDKFQLQNRGTREVVSGFVDGSLSMNDARRRLNDLLRTERRARGTSAGAVLNFAQRLNAQFVPSSSPLGGINLNPALLNLQIKRDTEGIPLPLPQQPVGDMNIEGFLPIIINITPVPSLPMLLGMTADEDPARGVTRIQGEENRGDREPQSEPGKTNVQFFFDEGDQLSLLNYN